MSIQEHLNKIRNAIYGREVREAIVKGIETAYDDASENGNANMEVKIARGTHPNLRSRLEEVDNKQQQTTAQLAHKVDDRFFESTVFTNNQDFNARWFRIPFLTTTNNGTIIAGGDVRYNGSSDWDRVDIGIARSTDGGKTWVDKQIVVENNNINSIYSRAMDGTIIYDHINNRLYVFAVKLDDEVNWFNKNTKTNWDVVYVTSDDEGRTWSEETSIAYVTNDFSNREVFMQGVGSGIVMKDGTIVLPVQTVETDNPTSSSSRIRSTIVYSKNSGSTWEMADSILPESSSEVNVVEYKEGELLLNARKDGSSHRALYTTTNLGSTWEPLENNTQFHPNRLYQSYPTMGSMIMGKTASGKEKILFSQPYSLRQDNRYDLSLLYSESGEDWQVAGTILSGRSQGYSSLSYHDSRLYVLLETSEGNLVFRDISKLLNIAEKRTTITNEVENIRQNWFISDVGDDRNSGYTWDSPVRSIETVLKRANYNKGNQINIYVLGNHERLTLKNIDYRLDKIIIRPSGEASIDGIDVTNVGCPIEIEPTLRVKGKCHFYNAQHVFFKNSIFNVNGDFAVRAEYSNVYFEKPNFMYNTLSQMAIKSIYSDIYVNDIQLTNGYWSVGIELNMSKLLLTKNNQPYSETDSLIANAGKTISSINTNSIENDYLFEVTSYAGGWLADSEQPLKYHIKGKNAKIEGKIRTNENSNLSGGATIFRIPKIAPVATKVLVEGFISSSERLVIPVAIDSTGAVKLTTGLEGKNIAFLDFYDNSLDINY